MKNTENVRTAATLLFYILQQYLTNVAYFSIIYYHHITITKYAKTREIPVSRIRNAKY